MAMAVPEPMVIPISAFFRAGASFTPSPVYMEKPNNKTYRQNISVNKPFVKKRKIFK